MGFLSPRATVALAMVLLATGAFAQDIVDQQNDPAGGSGFGCGSPTPILNGTIRQGFVPTADNLVAVELRLQAGSAFPAGGTTTTARILDGASITTVLGQATASVAGPLAATTQVLVRFDFAAIPLTPGNLYLIEWVTPPTTELMWVGSGGDTYPAGTAYSCSGNPWPVAGTDFHFTTYAAAPEPEPTTSEAPDCGDLLDMLRTAVGDLELRKFRHCSLNKLLDCAGRALAKGKPKAASANVLAVEVQIRALAKVGVIDPADALAIITLAEEFRGCLGVGPHRHLDWDDDHHDGHGQ